jgi:RNA polymerase sigma-70 factor (ECF subfamily)
LAEQFLQRIANGDASAVRGCLDEYGGMVWGLAKRYLAAMGDDAEDAVQEIFVEVWRWAGRYDPSKGTEAGFIATVAHRRLTDRQRRAMARRGGELPEDRVLAGAEQAPVFETKESASRAMAALGQLSAEERQVLWCSLYHGLSHERIAGMTSQPVGTVKTRIRRGLARLRELLSGTGAGGAGGAGLKEVAP